MNSKRNKEASWGYDTPEPFNVTVQTNVQHTFKIKLFGPIEDPSQFDYAIEAFERATDVDRVLVHLSSPGGSVDATDTFLNAMHNCAAPVHVMASGGCHSAATIILLNAPSFTLSDGFNCLIHNGSTGSYGKMSDYRAETRFTGEFMESLMRRTYEGFLSEEEIAQLIDGKDFWMGPEEFCQRAERRDELLSEAAEEEGLEKLEGAAEQLGELITKVKKTRKATATAEA
jgi:ATP-dependent protease ClpP protease subunit